MKKVLFLLSIGICLVIINNLVQSIMVTWQKQSFIVEAQKTVSTEEQKHVQLEGELKEVSQQQYVQEQARDELLLVKPGEELVLIPKNLLSPTPSIQDTKDASTPHWQQWVEYLTK